MFYLKLLWVTFLDWCVDLFQAILIFLSTHVNFNIDQFFVWESLALKEYKIGQIKAYLEGSVQTIIEILANEK